MSETRPYYKRIIRNAKYRYDKDRTAKLQKPRLQNAKVYCTGKCLKIWINPILEKPLLADIFADNFKATCINNLNDVFFQPDADAILFNVRYLYTLKMSSK